MTLAKVLISLTARNGSDSFPNSKINSFLLTNRAMSNLNVASSFAHFFNRFIGQYRSTNIQITFQKFPSSTSMARSAHTKAELRKPEATDNSFLSFSIKSQVKSFYDKHRWTTMVNICVYNLTGVRVCLCWASSHLSGSRLHTLSSHESKLVEAKVLINLLL